ncbi:hypothetical protein P7K49_014633 [Saguinus oedipus]|uniref:Uncharacterized protein n=1 Tax=Saguinus oedipus TaxID=9490 RepID=A0ABQ9V6X0_SAGOE|nr:hypothetical protein P7K49_014633 [Saguinus oedipus]
MVHRAGGAEHRRHADVNTQAKGAFFNPKNQHEGFYFGQSWARRRLEMSIWENTSVDQRRRA